MNPSIDILSDGINNGTFKNIVIMSGAGISTNAGIPDYRSRTGIFAEIANSGDYPDAQRPEDFFSRDFVSRHPELSTHPLVQQFKAQMVGATPTASHQLAKALADRNVLKRVYTQNVDGLYQKTGLDPDYIVEYHGNYADGSIVLYGDSIPVTATYQAVKDFQQKDIDLLIVMGSSLQVAPFCALPNAVPKKCVRVLVDINPENAMTNNWTIRKTLEFGRSQSSSIKVGGERATLRPLWQEKNKYKRQYIYTADCDDWAKALINALK